MGYLVAPSAGAKKVKAEYEGLAGRHVAIGAFLSPAGGAQEAHQRCPRRGPAPGDQVPGPERSLGRDAQIKAGQGVRRRRAAVRRSGGVLHARARQR